MERGPQYCVGEGEFSLPEGVDLVGADGRKSFQHSHPSPRRKSKAPSWKSAVKLVFINLFVCAMVLGYALLGSFIFLALENRPVHSSVLASTSGSPHRDTNLTAAVLSNMPIEQIQQLKAATVKNIWEITLGMNILYPDNWTKMTNEEVSNFQRFLLEKVLTAVKNVTVQESPYPWTFPRAFLFALTTLTTIGYGGIGPKTSSGKVATMLYAVFGIPIMLWYLSNVGSLLAKITRFCCAKLCCCCCRRPSSSSSSSNSSSSSRKISDPSYYNIKPLEGDPHPHPHREEEPAVSICFIFFLCVLVLLGYVCFGAWVLCRWEAWPFLDSFYFCFLTLTTISFGDSRSQRTGRLDQFKQQTEWFCSFYILFGMALTSMFFNILHEEISLRLKRWKGPPPPEMDEQGHVHQPHLGHPRDPSASQKGKASRPENSYSVHFMNFSPGHPAPAGRQCNFAEETLQNEVVHRGLSGDEDDPAHHNPHLHQHQHADPYMGGGGHGRELYSPVQYKGEVFPR